MLQIMPGMGMGQGNEASYPGGQYEEGSYLYKKQKWRSKKDTDGRIFDCPQCDKNYLSYPALYTHMKLKHKNIRNPNDYKMIGFESSRMK